MKTKIIRKIIKAEAWANMAGNWLKSFAVVIMEILGTMAIVSLLPLRIPSVAEIQNTSGDFLRAAKLFLPPEITERVIALCFVVLLLFLFLTSPFAIGRCRFFLKVGRGENAKIGDAFTPFASLKTVFSSIGLQIMIFFLTLFWEIVMMIIPFALMVVAVFFESVFILDIATVLLVISSFVSVLIASRYEFARYILADNENLGAIKALRECQKLMKTKSGECIKLRFSYILYDIFFSTSIGPFLFIYRIAFSTVYAKYLDYLRGDRTFMFEEVPPEM